VLACLKYIHNDGSPTVVVLIHLSYLSTIELSLIVADFHCLQLFASAALRFIIKLTRFLIQAKNLLPFNNKQAWQAFY